MDDSTEVQLVEVPKDSAAPPLKASSNGPQQQTPEELVARAIAPVKREFLRPPPVRPVSNNQEDGAVSEPKEKASQSGGVVKEKKSKRQLKRERRQVLSRSISIYIHYIYKFSVKMFVGMCVCVCVYIYIYVYVLPY